MTLDEVTSKRQLRKALREGDRELETDLEQAVRRLVVQAWSDATPEWEFMESEELVRRVDDRTLRDVLEEVPDGEALLATVPEATLLAALRESVHEAAQDNVQNAVSPGALFQFASGQGPGLGLGPVYVELRASVYDPPLSWVPKRELRELLRQEGPEEAQWDDINGDYSSGWIPSSDEWRLELDRDALHEWAVDQRTEYFSQMVDAAPQEAIAALMRVLQDGHPELAKKVKKAKLPQEVMADYAVAFFEDEETGIEILSQAMGEFGYAGSRGEVLLEVDRAALQALGITQGRWWDGAPWKLINLPVEELLYEGTLMRHCVGRRDMGYRDAVESGQAQVWSLRSRYNKPILTFEIDVQEWDTTDPVGRGGAIEQLKGKLNRLPGADDDEARVLGWILAQLGVAPGTVRDLARGLSSRIANPRGFDAPWQPYLERRRARLLRW